MVSDYRNSLTPPRPFLRLWRNVRRGQLTPPHLFRIGRYGTVWRFSLPQWDLAGDRICIQQQLVALICFHDEPCSMGMRISMGYAVLKSGANVCNGSSPCENVRDPRKRRTVFSIAFFGYPSPALLVFRLTKSRRTFYAQNE